MATRPLVLVEGARFFPPRLARTDAGVVLYAHGVE